ncbi:retrovirus-related pol polyprotein from transposon TNT 1-94 [Tanacetum coccineum]
MNHQTSSVLQIAYQSPQVSTQPMTESPLVDSGFVVHVFSPGDDLIACLNKAMSFLTTIASSRFPSTNNNLRTLSNLRNQDTIQDGRVTVQQVQGRQGQSYSGTGYKSNATSSEGNNASGHEKTEDLDTYDSDCDDISNAKAVLMANISNYGSDIISEVLHSETYLNDMENQSVHAMQDFQQSPVAQQDSMILFVVEQMSEQMINHVNNWEKVNKEQNNESVTAKLETYKERVKTFEQRLNIDLSSREKMIDSQMDDMIKEKLALKEQVDSLEQNLSKQIKEKECLLQTFTVFKNESKEKENKYMENEIDLEKRIKELDNIIFKVGQSAQTVHMLTKPQVFYDNAHKQALGYQNPFYLKKAQRIKPTLYDGIVISAKHVAMPVIDDEETLILEDESRSKILSGDFGKRFTPQQELSAEQAFWLRISNPTIESSNIQPVKVEVPSKLPKVSLVNASLKKLKFHLAQFDYMVKKRTTPDARTEDEWGFEHTKAIFNNEIITFLKYLKDIFNVFYKDLLNEIMEVQTVFDQMDAVVQQSSVGKQCLEIAKKELLLENDRLLQQIMSQVVLLTMMNSMSLNGESVNMKRKRNESCDKCFNLDAELLKSQNAHNDLLKSYSQLENHCISLELLIQFNQEISQKHESCDNQNALEILEFFENNDLKAQLHDNDTTICKLKEIIRSMREKSKKENVNYDYCEIETKNVELENSVAKLLLKNERLCKEINHVKQVFKDQFDSIKKTRVRTKEHRMFKLDLDPLAPRLLQNKEAYIDYLKYTQEQADILRGIVEQPKAKQPLDNALDFALGKRLLSHPKIMSRKLGLKCSTSNCGSKPTGNKKNDRILQTPSRNIKNKVEAQPKKVNKKNRVVEPIRDVDVKHSLLKANSKLICATCRKSMFDSVHDMCLLDFVENVNTHAKSAKKHKKQNIWKPTGHVFTEVGLKWKPTGRTFTIVVRFGNDHIARIMGYGDYQLGNVTVSRVYYVEGLGHNLFFVGQFCDADLEVAFRKNTCFIRNLEASKTTSWLWHRRLSHLNFGTLNKLAKDGLATDIPRLKFQKDHLCLAYTLGKSKKSSHQPKAEDTNQEKLYLLHMDLCGPMRVASINGKRYILVIVDDYSRFTWVRFLRTKDEAPEAIIKCIKNIQVRLNATVRNVRTDNGTEFVNQTLREFYENVGISHQTSVARTPQQNGVVERQNRTLVEAARTMLIFSKAPLFLWAEAINTACYTQNRSLIRL